MLDRGQREFLWEQVRGLYEDTGMTLGEIRQWAEEQTGWGPAVSAISNRARRYGWQPRQERCPIFPAGLAPVHLRDHYASAVRAEAKVRRGAVLSPTESEKLGQASSVIRDGLALNYTPESGFRPVPRPVGMPAEEWLTWWRDFEGVPGTAPVDGETRRRALAPSALPRPEI